MSKACMASRWAVQEDGKGEARRLFLPRSFRNHVDSARPGIRPCFRRPQRWRHMKRAMPMGNITVAGWLCALLTQISAAIHAGAVAKNPTAKIRFLSEPWPEPLLKDCREMTHTTG